ncbi:MAG: hypothetical protein ACYC1M_06770 [Armatimonadota bacterium]
MTPQEAHDAYKAECTAIWRLKDYTQRYTECKKLRERWNDAEKLMPLLKSDKMDGLNWYLLLSISLEYMMKMKVKLAQIEPMIHDKKFHDYFVHALPCLARFSEKRNDAALLGKSMGSFLQAFNVAISGEVLTPHMMKALHYYRKNRLMVVIAIQPFMKSVYDVLCNFSYMADPKATPLIQAYKQFRNEPWCRDMVVSCMLEYPADSREVRALMKQIAYNDPDQNVRRTAKYFFQKD